MNLKYVVKCRIEMFIASESGEDHYSCNYPGPKDVQVLKKEGRGLLAKATNINKTKCACDKLIG